MRVNERKMKRTIKIVLISLIVLLIVVGGFAFAYFKGIWDDPSKLFGRGSNYTFTDDSGNEHQYNQGVISFMIFGLDSDDEREEAHMGYRTDVMMLCVVDTEKNKASLVSLPRDTKARVQVLDKNGKTTKMVTTKLNAAFSYGFSPSKYGYQNALDAVNLILDSDRVKVDEIEHYVGFDMDGFVGISNALGGVELELPQDVPGFGKKGQVITLKGKDALEYVRIRKGSGLSGSDLDRTTRQRGFVEACIKKLQKENPIVVLPKLYNECISKGYVQTNMSIEQVTALASAVSKLNIEEASMEMLPGYLGDGYWIPDQGKVDEMLLRLYYNSSDGSAPVITTKKTTQKTTTTKKKTTTTKRTTVKTTTSKTTSKPTTTTTNKTTSKPTTTTTSKPTTTTSSKPTTSTTVPSSSKN